MIKNQKFSIKNIKNVIFLGYSKSFPEMKKINSSHKINTFIMTSPDQKKSFISKTTFHIFNKLDKKFNNFIKQKVSANQTLFVSIGSRWIFSKNTIEKIFNNNLVNFHGTRLPFDKGGASISWKILKNDRIDNQMVHLLDGGIDTGPVLMSDNSIYPITCKIPLDYENYYDLKQLNFYEKFIKKIKNNESIYLNEQANYIGSYNPRLNADISSWINWNVSSNYLYRFINAFDDPYKGAMTYFKNKKVRLKSVHLHGGEPGNHPFSTGIISRHDKKWIAVSTIDHNMLLVEKVIDEKNENIINKIKQGERFYTPAKNLDYSLSKKVKYTPMGFEK